MSRESSPAELRVSPDRKTLSVVWPDGTLDRLEAELLRVESPSAETQGHSPDEKVIVAGKRDVTIRAVEPVGSYAVRILFDDGHSTGIYTWRYFERMAERHDEMWRTYLAALSERGLTREP